jgi:hypothetical protein
MYPGVPARPGARQSARSSRQPCYRYACLARSARHLDGSGSALRLEGTTPQPGLAGVRGCEKIAGRREGVPGRVRQGAGSPKSGSVAGLRDPILGVAQRRRARPGTSAVGWKFFHSLSGPVFVAGPSGSAEGRGWLAASMRQRASRRSAWTWPARHAHAVGDLCRSARGRLRGQGRRSLAAQGGDEAHRPTHILLPSALGKRHG